MKAKTLTEVERLTLSNQYRILAKVDSKHAKEYLRYSTILERGYTILYEEVADEIYDEMPYEEGKFVFAVLNMFRDLDYQYNELKDKGGITKDEVTFHGWDGNNESSLLGLTLHVQEEGKWEEILSAGSKKPLNTHSTVRQRYKKMLERHAEITNKHDAMSKWHMSADDISYILG